MNEIACDIRERWLKLLVSLFGVIFLVTSLGVYILIVSGIKERIEKKTRGIPIYAYLKEGLSTEKIEATYKRIKSIKGVAEIKYVAKKEALEKLKRFLDTETIFEEIEINPLPDTFVIRVNPKVADLEEVAKRIGFFKNISLVEYNREVVSKIKKAYFEFKVIGFGFGILLFVTSFFCFCLILDGAIKKKKEELSYLVLMGAKYGLIKRPFLIEGILIGTVGSIISSISIFFVDRYILTKIGFEMSPNIFRICILASVFGVLLSAVISHIVVKRSLKFASILTLALFFSIHSYTASGLTLKSVAEARKQCEYLKMEIRKKREKLKILSQKERVESKNLYVLKQEIKRYGRDIREKERRIREKRSMLRRLKSSLNKARIKRKNLSHKKGRLVLKGYRYICLYGTETTSFPFRRREFLEIFEALDRKEKVLFQKVSKLNSLKDKVEKDKRILSVLMQKYIEKKRKKDKIYKEKLALLHDIRERRKKVKKIIKGLEDRYTKLSFLLKKLRSKRSYLAKGGGIFKKGFSLFPPAKGRVIVPFGKIYVEEAETYLYRRGVEVKVKDRSFVRSIFSGRIIYAGEVEGYRKVVIIDHGRDSISVYGFLGEVFKRKGERVKKGEIIGKVFKDSLYFEIRNMGKPINPTKWVAFR